jgi:UDP-glucuronate 4-epimerase
MTAGTAQREGQERFLVTGALGCIGAWTVRQLAREGVPVVAFDLGRDHRRLAQIMSGDELERVTFVVGDITDLGGVERTLEQQGITNVIHLAALQVPFCRADPPRGAMVNVVGTVNLFEAVKRQLSSDAPLVYTSSIAVYAPSDTDPASGRLIEGVDAHPLTHYGVYKLANEGTARIYAADDGIASIGIRPMTVYGVGRDQGMTSTPTVAIAAAVLGQPYEISFSGQTLFQYAEDVARTLIAASRSSIDGANVFNLGGDVVDIADWVAAIEAAVPESRGLLTIADAQLPFPSEIDHDGLAAAIGPVTATPYEDGIRSTVETFRGLAADDRLVPADQGVPQLVPNGRGVAQVPAAPSASARRLAR